MVIFHSYVKLPEGKPYISSPFLNFLEKKMLRLDPTKICHHPAAMGLDLLAASVHFTRDLDIQVPPVLSDCVGLDKDKVNRHELFSRFGCICFVCFSLVVRGDGHSDGLYKTVTLEEFVEFLCSHLHQLLDCHHAMPCLESQRDNEAMLGKVEMRHPSNLF
jgi:hypothetical protein